MNSREPRESARRAGRAPLFTCLGLFLALVLPVLAGRQAHAGQALTPAEVIARGEERFRSLQDYECTVDVETKLAPKVVSGSGRFWFKQPRMLRVRVTDGPGKGSEVAVDSQGQIRGRRRGLLSFVVKRLQANDRRLHTLRGTSMLELDWGSFFLRYPAAALRPDAVIALAPRQDPNSLCRVVVTYPDLGKSVREVYSLDPRQWIIVEGELCEGDVRVEHVVFRDIKFDTGVAPAFFRL
jgi:outer membrane lipoprotein-sorting protein